MKFNSGLDMQGNEIKLSAPEYVSELPNTNLFKGRTVMVVIPGVAPNPDTGMLYYYSGAQWILLDHTDAITIATVVEEDNGNPVSSDAVYDAIQDITIPTAALEGLGMRNFAPGQTGCKNIAHRGVYVAPENTVVGMQAAKMYGFNYVEFDVKWSKDGVPVVIHDDTVDRTTDNEYSGNVKDFTFDELSAMDVGKYKNPTGSDIYTGTRIPSFKQMLLAVRMLNLHPYIEIHDTGGTWTAARVKQCVDIVKELHMERDVTWIGAQIPWLKEVLKEDPSARIGWATGTFSNQTHVNQLLELKTPYNQIFLDFSSNNSVTGSQEATDVAAQLCHDNGIPFEIFCSESGNQGCMDANCYCSGSTSDRFQRFGQYTSLPDAYIGFNPWWGSGDEMSNASYGSGTWHEYATNASRFACQVGRTVDTTIDFIWDGPSESGSADHNEYTLYIPNLNADRKFVPRYDKYFTIMGIKDDAPTTPHWFMLIKICGKLSETPGHILILYNNAPTGCHFRHTLWYTI